MGEQRSWRAAGWAVVLVAALSACLSVDSVQCADGWQCAAGQVCAPGGGGCAPSELVSACVGVDDGGACEVGVLGAGVCQAGICVLAGCGDGVRSGPEQCDDGDGNRAEPNATCRPGCTLPQCGDGIVDDVRGEVCDDGNRLDGDGCRPDCASTETCGNAVIDFAVGELCDDAGRRPGDGCSATCTPEVPLWARRLLDLPPGGADVYATDPVRQRMVRLSDHTDEWDGGSWVRHSPRVSPGRRFGAALAYDPVRRHVLLFGGTRGQTARRDTWTWDGLDWRELSLAASPGQREQAAMAYDPRRGVMLLFGGRTGPSEPPLGDTWAWDGRAWTELTPSVSPPALSAASMATDFARGEVILVGGYGGTGGGPGQSETWRWDGARWISAGVIPVVVVDRTLVFDRALQRLVLQPAGGSAAPAWTWDGSTWSQLAAAPVGADGRLAVHPVTGQAVFAPGLGGVLRVLTGAAWTPVAAPVVPSPRADAGFASWPALGRVVLFAGRDGDAPADALADTWAWDGTRWHDLTATAGVGPTGTITAAATDPVAGVIAITSSVMANTTWRYDASGWRALAAPTPRPVEGGIAYDRARNRVVLATIEATGLGVWEWDGASWTDRTPAVGVRPALRFRTAMSYDDRLGRVVLYGGWLLQAEVTDTWTWDGAQWTELTVGGVVPRVTTAWSLAYDPDRARTVLFGGGGNQTWEFDGQGWQQLSFDQVVGTRGNHHAATDPRGGVVVFGGDRVNPASNQVEYLADTWRLRYGADSDSCATGVDRHGAGAGCADPACWHECAPSCPPGTSCPADAPRCGDGTCSALETCRSCPGDCPPCVPACGDTLCDPGEAATCPADCPP